MINTTSVPVSSWKATAGAYFSLMKPHVTVLLLGTTLAAMVVAHGGTLPALGTVVATLLGGALAAGSANSINCYYDRDIDLLMSRTRTRALPTHRVSDRNALIFGIVLGVTSFLLLTFAVNLLSAALATSAILFYVFIYTIWLKRSSTQNIVIGGAAGSVPVLVGWAAVTNTLALPALWMFMIIFLWTPPHFWALSLVLKKDYERAGVPMLPVVKGERVTHRQIVLYSFLLFGATLVLFLIHSMGYLYLTIAVISGLAFVVASIRLARGGSLPFARSVFWFSNYYLVIIFAAMVLDRMLH
jgi:heme o synthase